MILNANMIKILDKTEHQVHRIIPDLFEPYVVKLLQKQNHTFFIYRCSEYPILSIF